MTVFANSMTARTFRMHNVSAARDAKRHAKLMQMLPQVGAATLALQQGQDQPTGRRAEKHAASGSCIWSCKFRLEPILRRLSSPCRFVNRHLQVCDLPSMRPEKSISHSKELASLARVTLSHSFAGLPELQQRRRNKMLPTSANTLQTKDIRLPSFPHATVPTPDLQRQVIRAEAESGQQWLLIRLHVLHWHILAQLLQQRARACPC